MVVLTRSAAIARAAALVLSSVVLAACAPPAEEHRAADSARPAPAGPEVGPMMTAAEYLREPRFAAADLARGELLSLACIACHTFRPGEADGVGPNLGGLTGSSAAFRPGFGYSEALRETGLVWTPQLLDAWIAAPSSVVPGTSMVFAGYASPDDRRDLIAYLLNATEPQRP